MKLRISLSLALLVLLSQVNSVAMAYDGPDLVLQGGKIYSSPTASPVDNAVVLIQNGRIAAVGSRSELKVPSSARMIDCTGKVIIAGFWNSHVHFETGWEDVLHAPAEKAEAHIQEMTSTRRKHCRG